MKNIGIGLLLCLFILFITLTSPAAQVRTADLTIEPAKGRAAAAIKIKGSKFQPKEAVEIIMQVGDIYHSLGTEKTDVVTADDKGAFDVGSGIPVGTPPGLYKIEAIGDKGTTATFNLEVVR